MERNQEVFDGEVLEENESPKKKFKINPKTLKKALIWTGAIAGGIAAAVLLNKPTPNSEVSPEDPNITIGEIVEHEDGSTSITITEHPAEVPAE